MGRSPCCSKEGMNRGAWSALEDKILKDYIKVHGDGRWRSLPKKAGLKRCGKSCRLRWLNYLRPDIKRGNISPEEEELIVRLHKLLGNRWSLIAGRLPGRTDNEIKNYWNTNLSKKLNNKKCSSASTLNHTPQHNLQIMRRPRTESNLLPIKASPSSAAPKMKSKVVHTKAIKCSKVFLNPQPNKIQHFHTNSTEASPRPSMHGDDNVKPEELFNAYDNRLLSAFGNGENDQSDFMANFDMCEPCLSDPLNFNFSELCDFKDLTLSDCFEPTVASNLCSFASFLGSEGDDWLGQ